MNIIFKKNVSVFHMWHVYISPLEFLYFLGNQFYYLYRKISKIYLVKSSDGRGGWFLKGTCTVSQQQFQPRMQITQDFIFDKLICYSYVQEYVIE